MRALSALLLMLGAAACDSGEQPRVNQGRAQARTESGKCAEMVSAVPSWTIVKSKLPPPDHSPIPPQILADPTRPTKDEVLALLAVHEDGITRCRRDSLESASRRTAAFVGPIARAIEDENFLHLVKGEIGWGDYAWANARWWTETGQKIGLVLSELRRRYAYAEAYEEQWREAANVGLQAWMEAQQQLNRQQRLLDPTSQPRTTRCQYVETALSCTTF